jgi:hypothetical protein
MKGIFALGSAASEAGAMFLPFISFALTALWLGIVGWQAYSATGFNAVFKVVGMQILAAEQNIKRVVDLAIANSPDYNLIALLSLFASLHIAYLVIKIFAKLLEWFTGSQAVGGTIVFAIIIFAIVEASAIGIVDGSFTFVPVKDGIVYLLFNLQPIFANISFF